MYEIIVPETGLPLKFPDHRVEAAEQARKFRELSPADRMRAMGDVLSMGIILMRSSPKREIIDKMFLKREAEWQRIQRELFSHVR